MAGILGVSSGWLWFEVIQLKTETAALQIRVAEAAASPSPTPVASPRASQTPLPSPTAPVTSFPQVQNQLDALQTRITALENQPTPAPFSGTSAQTTSTTKTSPATKQVIYLGAASTTKRDWNATGLEVTLNSADYPANTPITFEAGLSAVGGEAWARLVNKTTGGILNTTELSNGTSTPTWKSSPVFYLQPGTNTYAVEMKSTSDEVAQLSGSRLQIGK